MINDAGDEVSSHKSPSLSPWFSTIGQRPRPKVDVDELRKQLRKQSNLMSQLLKRGTSVMRRDSNNEISDAQIRSLLLAEMQAAALSTQKNEESPQVVAIARSMQVTNNDSRFNSDMLEQNKTTSNENDLHMPIFGQASTQRGSHKDGGPGFRTKKQGSLDRRSNNDIKEWESSPPNQPKLSPFQNQLISYMHDNSPTRQPIHVKNVKSPPNIKTNTKAEKNNMDFTEIMEKQLATIQERRKVLKVLEQLMGAE